MKRFGIVAPALLMAALTGPASAQEPVKIGLVTTLSTPVAYLGEDIKAGFELAIAQEGGRLGGVAVKLLAVDDSLNATVAKEAATRLLESEKVKILSGGLNSIVTLSMVPQILASNAYWIAANSAPIPFDGANCHPRYFVASWHNTGAFEATSATAAKMGQKKALLMAANFAGGKEAMDSWKATFQGSIQDEMLVKFNQTDLAGEISQLKLSRPEAIFTFMPGGMGIAFLRQLHQAGLRNVKIFPGMTLDSRMVQAVGDGALTSVGSTIWNDDLANPANLKFIADFQKTHSRLPTVYAAQAYDAARLIGSALKAANGNVDADNFRTALRAAKFDSVRGNFSFDTDQHPIQDWYRTEVRKSPSGEYRIHTVEKVLSNHRPPLAKECKINS
jgi:branched-chain amino acid transport system substrate-binding protein